MPFYCKFHPDFEGLDVGKLHDHIDRDHPEIQQGASYKHDFEMFFRENIVFDDLRRSDQRMVVRTWGRPPKLGQYVADSEVEKK